MRKSQSQKINFSFDLLHKFVNHHNVNDKFFGKICESIVFNDSKQSQTYQNNVIDELKQTLKTDFTKILKLNEIENQQKACIIREFVKESKKYITQIATCEELDDILNQQFNETIQDQYNIPKLYPHFIIQRLYQPKDKLVQVCTIKVNSNKKIDFSAKAFNFYTLQDDKNDMEGVMSNHVNERCVEDKIFHELRRQMEQLFNFIDEGWNRMHLLSCEFIIDPNDNNLMLMNIQDLKMHTNPKPINLKDLEEQGTNQEDIDDDSLNEMDIINLSDILEKTVNQHVKVKKFSSTQSITKRMMRSTSNDKSSRSMHKDKSSSPNSKKSIQSKDKSKGSLANKQSKDFKTNTELSLDLNKSEEKEVNDRYKDNIRSPNTSLHLSNNYEHTQIQQVDQIYPTDSQQEDLHISYNYLQFHDQENNNTISKGNKSDIQYIQQNQESLSALQSKNPNNTENLIKPPDGNQDKSNISLRPTSSKTYKINKKHSSLMKFNKTDSFISPINYQVKNKGQRNKSNSKIQEEDPVNLTRPSTASHSRPSTSMNTRPSTANQTRPSTSHHSRPNTAKNYKGHNTTLTQIQTVNFSNEGLKDNYMSDNIVYDQIEPKKATKDVQLSKENEINSLEDIPNKSDMQESKNFKDEKYKDKFFRTDDDLQEYLVNSLHNMNLSRVSNLPQEVDKMEVRKIDLFRKQINVTAKNYSKKFSRGELMLKFVGIGQKLKDALNISCDQLEHATCLIKERDIKISELEQNIERTEHYYRQEVNNLIKVWKGKTGLFYKNLRSSLDDNFKLLREENLTLRQKLDTSNQEKTNLEVEITEADADQKDSLIKESQSQKIQRMLTDQIEKLREEKGMNRIGLNKEKLIEKMEGQLERIGTDVSNLQKDIKASKIWAVHCMDDLKAERAQRSKLEDQLNRIIYERTSGNKDTDFMQREEARMMINNEKCAFKDTKGREKDQDRIQRTLPKFIREQDKNQKNVKFSEGKGSLSPSKSSVKGSISPYSPSKSAGKGSISPKSLKTKSQKASKTNSPAKSQSHFNVKFN